MKNDNEPCWGEKNRFYLPNEDAGIVTSALSLMDPAPMAPLFICGSGMLALEAAGALAREAEITLVDISAFQVDYFKRLKKTILESKNTGDLLSWFKREVYPELSGHFSKRGEWYPLTDVLAAMKGLFGINFFFDDRGLDKIRGIINNISIYENEISHYLSTTRTRHDFVYLGNIPDYLPCEKALTIFSACGRMSAWVYLLLTGACPDQEFLQDCWIKEGYREHPVGEELNRKNRGLGSHSLIRKWNRKGMVYLLEGSKRFQPGGSHT